MAAVLRRQLCGKWDFNLKLYRNIVVSSGKTLTIASTLDAVGSTTIVKDFEVTLGSELEIK